MEVFTRSIVDLPVSGFGGGAAAGDNDGDGVFEDMAAVAGLAFTKSATESHRHGGPTFAYIDGGLDLFVGGILGSPTFIFTSNIANTGNATFTDVTATAGIEPERHPEYICCFRRLRSGWRLGYVCYLAGQLTVSQQQRCL